MACHSSTESLCLRSCSSNGSGRATDPNARWGKIRQQLRLPSANVQVQPAAYGTEPIRIVEYAERLFTDGQRALGIHARSFDQVATARAKPLDPRGTGSPAGRSAKNTVRENNNTAQASEEANQRQRLYVMRGGPHQAQGRPGAGAWNCVSIISKRRLERWQEDSGDRQCTRCRGQDLGAGAARSGLWRMHA